MASVKQIGNSYKIVVSNGYDVKGKKLRETTTFTPDPNMTPKQQQRALESFVYEFEQKVKNGKYLDGEKITLKEFSKRWVKEYATKQLEPSTLNRYLQILDNQILPALGHIRLSKLQPLHLQSFYNNLLEDGVRKDGQPGGYSPGTIRKCHAIISIILKIAVQWQIIESNICERVSPPKQRNEIDKANFFTPEQATIFLDSLTKTYATEYKAHDRIDDTGKRYHVDAYYERRAIPLQFQVFFNLSLFGGLRKGETLALTWDDIDFGNNTINITKSVSLVDGNHIIKPPKNKTSIRVVSIPESVFKLLKKHKLEHNTKRIKLGDYWQDGNHLFTQENGTLMNYSTPYHAFKDILKKYNNSILKNPDLKEEEKKALLLPNITLHGLRHTSATLLISEHVDIRTVSARLGHAQTSTTMNIYAHSLKQSDKKAADKLENLFNKQT